MLRAGLLRAASRRMYGRQRYCRADYGRGIRSGAATARRLFDAGASVVLIDLPSSAGAAFARS